MTGEITLFDGGVHELDGVPVDASSFAQTPDPEPEPETTEAPARVGLRIGVGL